jgi:hypothetical protein
MSVKRLILDSGVLDQDRIIGTGTVVLDSRAVLDSNIIAGTDYNGNVSYNDSQTLYNGSKIIYDFADAPMGGMSATVQSTPQIIVSASAELGAISSIAQAGVAHFASGATSFGSLDATANSTPTILPTFDAQLGSLVASVNAVTTITAQAISSLGSLTASSNATPEIDVTASAVLGSLIASATATQPQPPTPSVYGSNGYVPIKKKEVKKEPVFVPEIPEIVDTPELEPLIKSVFAKGSSDLSGLYAQSGNRIDFSILADEAEILSLL